MSFDDLLPAVALALLAGLNGARAGRIVLFILPVAWLGGGIVGVLAGSAAPPSIVTSLSLLALGVLTAASARLRPSLVAVLATTLGLMHGWLNGAGIAVAGREASGLFGIAGTIFVVVALAAALVVSLPEALDSDRGAGRGQLACGRGPADARVGAARRPSLVAGKQESLQRFDRTLFTASGGC